MYSPRHPLRSRTVPIRGLRYHVCEWGEAGAPPLVLLHGWMDVGASFQFVVDQLQRRWHVLAPDWRGFGATDWPAADCYWFADYLGDLDALLDALCGAAPVTLLGHSMGGNVALLYAGIRPARVGHLVNIEGFGLRDARPEEAPQRYAQWLDELKARPGLRDYESLADVASRLRRTNPRLSEDKAQFLAQHWSTAGADGRRRLAGDPAHRLVNPVLYRFAEVQACWARIRAPVLWIEGAQTDAHKWAGGAAVLAERRAALPGLQYAVVEAAGHMVHHDQPAAVARLIEGFVDAGAVSGGVSDAVCG
ncbi:MAG: alpha/beta fold hydrolase [Betaproteobacteria bacterium]|nr:alpha/beta fold hydrolase [Burkholderiales bacterium]